MASAQIIAAGQSHPGQRRTLNEDAWWIAQEPDTGSWWARRGRLFIVADGMGGHAAGEIASQLAVETLAQVYYGRDDTSLSPAMRLEQAIQAANRRVYEQAATQDAQAGMGTTVVAAVVHDGWLTIANVGDSRAYRVRGGLAQQITRDHSWVAEQVTAGALTQEEARNHIYKNVVTRCLGHRPTVQTDLFEQALEVGDIVLLCSDGLSNQVTDGELAGILTESATAMPAAVATLLKLANERGAPDNITAVAFQVLALPAGWKQGEPTVPARVGAANGQVTMVVPARSSGARAALPSRAAEVTAHPRPAARPRKASKLRIVLFAALAVWGIVLCAAGIPLMASRWDVMRDWLGWPAATSTSGPPGMVTPLQSLTVTPTIALLPSATPLYTPTTAGTTAAPATATSTLVPTVTVTLSPTATLTLTAFPPAGTASVVPTATITTTLTLTVTQP
jgi:serine/threonine protein phosphatase PrpC